MRVLGVDYGSRRTGLALSDPLGITCSPLVVLSVPDTGELVARIAEIAQQYGADEIVVGMPRPLAGGSNPQSDKTSAFKRQLAASVRMPVRTSDERFTSKLAAGGTSSRATPRDAVAACYMLQSYLDSQANSREDA
jgi:putative Holliday junction resolvase